MKVLTTIHLPIYGKVSASASVAENKYYSPSEPDEPYFNVDDVEVWWKTSDGFQNIWSNLHRFQKEIVEAMLVEAYERAWSSEVDARINEAVEDCRLSTV